MPRPCQLALSPEEQTVLVVAHDHHPTPYVRERAAAILKVAVDHSVRWVAEVGGLKRHTPAVVSGWIRRFRQARTCVALSEGSSAVVSVRRWTNQAGYAEAQWEYVAAGLASRVQVFECERTAPHRQLCYLIVAFVRCISGA